MKKRILAIMLAIMTVAAVGCGKKTEVTLGEYKGIALTRVSDSAVEEQIQKTLENKAELLEVDRPAEKGDTVNINYVGMKDDVAFEGGTDDSEAGTNLTIDDNGGGFIPGFADGLIGASAGQNIDLNLTFPDPYTNNPDLAGQAVVFHVTVNAVKEKVIPKLTDEFVQANSDYESVDEYKTALREAMNQEAFYQQILDSLMASCEVENYPEDRITQTKENFVNNYTMYAQYYGSLTGMDTETALKYFFNVDSMQALEEAGETYAYNVVKQQLILEKISEIEKLSVSDERYDTEIVKYAEQYNYETVEEFLAVYKEEDVRKSILMYVAMEFCIANAVISDAE